MRVLETEIPGVLIVEPQLFGDARGSFVETHRQETYAAAGIAPEGFVQDNLSLSRGGVLRGLHYQWPNPQGKLVQVLTGEVFDVAIDIRVGSPTYGKWIGAQLSGENRRQLYVPPGFAHGFAVLSESALFAYKCTAYYDPSADRGVAWDDPEIAIAWPIAAPELSAKDCAAPRLAEIPKEKLPIYVPPTGSRL
jgi:dTDP-4-dehydrorhamnose 3,5-epimerase